MEQKTAEVELSKEKAALVLKLIDRANKLGDEIKLLQSLIKLKGHKERELSLLHDELDVVRDYREITLERIAVITLGDQKPKAQQGTLGTLENDDQPADAWDSYRSTMYEASKK